jgi:cellulose synthase/poly-beta-1,6-N-acetylglucosamine synthase-like glycosyltransferase
LSGSKDFSVTIYLIASVVVFLDLFDFLVRMYWRRTQSRPADRRQPAPTSIPLNVGRFNPYQRKLHLQHYALAISVYNLGDGVAAFVEAMAPHRGRLYVIDDASTDNTAYHLENAGLQVIRSNANRHKPGAIRELLRHLPKNVQTILIMDPDSRVLELVTSDISTLESVIFDFQRTGHAALCPRILVRGSGWLTRFQKLEYALTFGVGRKSLGDASITSGVAVYRRDALEAMLTEHSLSVYAEDLENALRLLARGEHIYYDERLAIDTEVKTRIADLFSQRVGWSFGLAKVYAQNGRELWRIGRVNPMRFYQYAVYLGLFSIAFHPLKILSLIPLFASALNGIDWLLGSHIVPDNDLTSIWYFPLVYVKYTTLVASMIGLAVPRGERIKHWPVAMAYLFYAIAQLAPMTVGFLNWIFVRVTGRRLYRDHFADDAHAHS